MAYRCPSCGRSLPNRDRPRCGYCAAPIPVALRIPSAKKEFLDGMRAEQEKRHREFLERDSPDNGRSSAMDIGDIGGADMGGD